MRENKTIVGKNCMKNLEVRPALSISIVLADDSQSIRFSLKAILEGISGVCISGQASDGRQALAMIEELTPDIVFLDVCMPILDGIEVARRIKQKAVCTKVIMFTSNEEALYPALAAGADGFCLKGSSPTELEQAIRAVIAGRKWPALDYPHEATHSCKLG